MSTYLQDNAFIKSIIDSDLLRNAIDWISQNMSPEDVFSKDQLETWAENNGFVKE